MEEWIDRRFKINFGNLEYKPGKDDPMGLALVGNFTAAHDASTAEVGAGPPQEAAGVSLDAFGKGKSGGKGVGDGKCRTCGGDGHFAR